MELSRRTWTVFPLPLACRQSGPAYRLAERTRMIEGLVQPAPANAIAATDTHAVFDQLIVRRERKHVGKCSSAWSGCRWNRMVLGDVRRRLIRRRHRLHLQVRLDGFSARHARGEDRFPQRRFDSLVHLRSEEHTSELQS